MSEESKPQALPVVVDPDTMDDATLLRHINARHTPIGFLKKVEPDKEKPGEKLLRAYHDKVHQYGREPNLLHGRPVNHDHEEEL